MAYQQIPGPGLLLPCPYGANTSYLTAATQMTALGMKTAQIGRVFFNSRSGTKNIQTIFFKWGGALVKGGGSTIKVSIQNPSLTAGPPGQPDGTVIQSFTIANADANFSAGNLYQGTLGAVMNVAFGQQIAVVFEFATFGGTDSVAIATGQSGNSNVYDHQALVSFYNNTSWVVQAAIQPLILFGFDDGTFGTLDNSNANPYMSLNMAGQTISGTFELALQWQLPFPCKIDAVVFTGNFNAAAVGTAIVTVYDGTTAMASVTIDLHTTGGNTQRTIIVNLGQEVTCLANHNYYVGVRVGTGGTLSVLATFVTVAAHFQALPGGQNFYLANRANTTLGWTTTTTTRPLIAIRVSSLDDGVQVGGGGTTNVFMIED